MLLEVPDRGAPGSLVGPDPLEYAAAVVQGVGEHVDLGLMPRHELAVHPDRLDLGDRHSWDLLVSGRSGPHGGSKDTGPLKRRGRTS